MTISYVCFYSSGVITSMQTKAPTKRGIWSFNFVVITLEYYEFSNPWKNKKYCLDLAVIFFVHTLDTLWHTQEISKPLE